MPSGLVNSYYVMANEQINHSNVGDCDCQVYIIYSFIFCNESTNGTRQLLFKMYRQILFTLLPAFERTVDIDLPRAASLGKRQIAFSKERMDLCLTSLTNKYCRLLV